MPTKKGEPRDVLVIRVGVIPAFIHWYHSLTRSGQADDIKDGLIPGNKVAFFHPTPYDIKEFPRLKEITEVILVYKRRHVRHTSSPAM